MERQWTKGRDNKSQHEIYWQSNELHRNCFRGQEIIIIDLQCRRLVDYNLQLLCNYYGFITFEFAQPAQANIYIEIYGPKARAELCLLRCVSDEDNSDAPTN